MMKVSVTIILTIVFLAFVSPIAAETALQNESEYNAETEMRRKEFIEARATKAQDWTQKVETRITERAEKKEAIREKFLEQRSEVALVHATRLENHFTNYYNRLNSLAKKIQTRIDLAKSAGKNTTEAQEKLSTAITSLDSAKSLGEQAVAAFKAIDPEKYSEQRDQALAARDLAQNAKEEFRTALREMKEAVKLLIELNLEEE